MTTITDDHRKAARDHLTKHENSCWLPTDEGVEALATLFATREEMAQNRPVVTKDHLFLIIQKCRDERKGGAETALEIVNGCDGGIITSRNSSQTPGRTSVEIALRAALRNMADAYVRKVKTGLTADEIAKEPWRCMEYVEAEQLCMTPFKLHFTKEWLIEKIKNDPDLPCEVGPLPSPPEPTTTDAGGKVT